MKDKNSERYNEAETVARREAALKRMLSTPHYADNPLKHRRKKKVHAG
jgi:hypothetical protein